MRRKVEVEMDPLLPADLGRADPVYPLLATRVCAVLSLPSGLIELVVAYATPYQMRGYRSDKLECAGNEPIQGTERAFAYRMSEGTVVSWGDKQGWSNQVQARLKYAKALCANRVAFAAIAADDTVVCWGPHTDDTQTIDEMVEGICASDEAFAALKMDGTVMAWGNKDQGGDCSSVQSQLKRVRAISSTLHAFAAVLHDGTVETWGHPDFGGSIPLSTKERLWQVLSISGSDRAFAALMEDGTVETWGKLEFPVASAPWRTCTRDAAELTNGWGDVVAICAAAEAFAALRRDGTVVCLPSVMTELKGVVAISSTKTLFAALKSDGHVVTWGGDFSNGEARASSDTVQQLYNVVAVYGGPYAFAALRGDGTVVTWGHEEYGGDSSKVQKDLRQVVAIRSTAKAFAARRSDGYVVTWGSSFFGGDRSSVPALRLPGETFRIYLHRVLFCGVLLVFIGCLTIPVALAITHRVD